MRIPDIAPTEKAMPTAALSHVYRQYACQNNTFTSCSESAGRELTSVIESTEAARIRAGSGAVFLVTTKLSDGVRRYLNPGNSGVWRLQT